MSFSTRRRNYMLSSHRTDGLIEWMKKMLSHSFVLDMLGSTAPDTFSHFEQLIDEHILIQNRNDSLSKNSTPKPPGPNNINQNSKLKQIVPTVGRFHTKLPLRRAFEYYDNKYCVTKRKFVSLSFNELRQILNLSQVMELCDSPLASSTTPITPGSKTKSALFTGPKLVTFDGDQTLYTDGANFSTSEESVALSRAITALLQNGVTVAIVTAAGYDYASEKYELRISGLLEYFKKNSLSTEDAKRFYLFGGECNFLLRLDGNYKLQPVSETGAGGWYTSTKHMWDSPANWEQNSITDLLDLAESSIQNCMEEQKLKAKVLRKKRAIGLIPLPNSSMTREALDETVLRVQTHLHDHYAGGLPFCAFNGGRDAWVDVGNKRVGVSVLQAYVGAAPADTLHIGDQFLNTGNDYAARDCCPCIWITSPTETEYILRKILLFGGKPLSTQDEEEMIQCSTPTNFGGSGIKIVKRKREEGGGGVGGEGINTPLAEMNRRSSITDDDMVFDVFTGEMVQKMKKKC